MSDAIGTGRKSWASIRVLPGKLPQVAVISQTTEKKWNTLSCLSEILPDQLFQQLWQLANSTKVQITFSVTVFFIDVKTYRLLHSV